MPYKDPNDPRQQENYRRYRDAHPDEIREASRRWKEAHPEQQKEAERRWREGNKGYSREWYQANKEKALEYQRRYRAAHPEKRREIERKFHWMCKLRVLAKLGGKCAVCGIADPRVLEVNHVGGKKQKETTTELYQRVLDGRRTTKDLNVLCANHNRIHEYERGRRYQPLDFSLPKDSR